MKYTGLTPVHQFGNIWVKREDLACWTDLENPSGSKVRQYQIMVDKSPEAPCIVGCSSFSAMQIYVAAAAKRVGVKGIVYVSARKELTDATAYCVRLGAEVNQVLPGYMNVVRKRARDRAKLLGKVVTWDISAALQDACDQCANLPAEVKRVVIPTGSGLTASGVLTGLAIIGHQASVLAVAVSGLADADKIQQDAMKLLHKNIGIDQLDYEDLPKFEMVASEGKYEDFVVWRLDDGTPLDPFYSAKAVKYLRAGDCLWPVGLRPISAMPRICQLSSYAKWKGPK